jgi:hypothetical protein
MDVLKSFLKKVVSLGINNAPAAIPLFFNDRVYSLVGIILILCLIHVLSLWKFKIFFETLNAKGLFKKGTLKRLKYDGRTFEVEYDKNEPIIKEVPYANIK